MQTLQELGAGGENTGLTIRGHAACQHAYVRVCGLQIQPQTELVYFSCGYAAGSIPAAKAGHNKPSTHGGFCLTLRQRTPAIQNRSQ